MTSLDKNAITVNSLGSQAQSQRQSAPSYGISKVGRDARNKVFLGEEYMRPGRLGRESPIGGAIYDLPSTLNAKPEVKFSTGKRPDLFPKPQDHPGDIPTNDALHILVDNQKYKYPKIAETIIGTDPRGKLKEAELMKAHAAAFFGRESAGPASIGGEGILHALKQCKPKMAPARKFGIKTPLKPDWTDTSNLPPEVGPGVYPRTDTSIGKQYLTSKRNQSVHEFPHGPKFPKTRSADSVSKLDAAPSCFGKQKLGKNKSEPSINFNCDTRASRDRSQICRTNLDRGPSAFMPKQQFSMPSLPSERAVLRGGIG